MNSRLKTIAIVLARMTSTRLPGKGLMEIAGKPLLWHVVQRLRHVAGLDEIVLATTNRPEDKPLVAFAEANDIPSLAWDGEVDDVMGRIVCTGESQGADIVVTISGDCPLVHPQFVDRMIRTLLRSGKEMTRVTPGVKCLHEGIGVLTLNAWKKLSIVSEEPYQREHAGIYLKEHPEFLSAAEVVPEEIYQRDDHRMSVDNTADLAFMRKIYQRLYHPGEIIELRDVVELLDAEPALRAINGHVLQKGIHEKSKRVAFWIDAGAAFGIGHFRRCLPLAKTLHENHHCGVLFLTSPSDAAARLFDGTEFPTRFLQARPKSTQELEEVVGHLKAFEADAVILDQKAPVAENCIEALRESGYKTVVVDDISAGSKLADLVVVPAAHLSESFDPHEFGGNVFYGAPYVLLNREFDPVLEMRKKGSMSRPRILISMGGSDPEALTLRAFNAVSQMSAAITIVAGPFFMFGSELAVLADRSNAEIDVRQDVPNLAALFSQTDIAIISFGVTVYEAARMGVPAVVVARTRTDAECAARLDSKGICRSVGYWQETSSHEIGLQVDDLLNHPNVRAEIGRTASALIDGKGVQRVAKVIMAELACEEIKSEKVAA